MVAAMEHKVMQLLQEVMLAEASREEEKVHLVLSLEDGHKLQQVLHLVPPQRKVVLVHIHRPAMMIPIPTMGGTVHATILKDNIVRDYREEQRDQALQALKGYQEICSRADVEADIQMIENDNVAAGLLELIAGHKITTLVIVGIGKSWVNRSRRNLAAALQRGADPSCKISFLQKGKLISVSQQDGGVFAFETEGTPFVSSHRLSLSCSSGSSQTPFLWDSRSTPSSVFWDSRSPPDSLDPSQLDDPSLENAGSILGDNRLNAILGHESINPLRELARHLNLAQYSQELHQAFQLRNSEITNRCQLIGGIDLVLGADSENFGEEDWKTIKGWPAAFDHIVRVTNTMLQILKQNRSECDGLTPDRLSRAAEEPLSRLLNIALAVTEVRKTPEKLFCVLYMCKALADSTPPLRKVFSADFVSRAERVLTVLNDSAKEILREFKVLIQNYSSRKVTQDGSILLLTGYVMKFIRLLINHSGSLDTILGHGESDDLLSVEGINLTGRLICGLIGDLNDVIQEKSWLYASSEGLRCIFLMNNTHFIIQEVEHPDIKLIIGAEWLNQRWGDFNRHMRDYMSSWEQVTSPLAIAVAASPPHKKLKPSLLGLFHTTPRPLQNFESSFNETCNSQMYWKVPSPVLRNKLRANILEHVVQAYRAYLETLKHSSMGSTGNLEPMLKGKVSELFEG